MGKRHSGSQHAFRVRASDALMGALVHSCPRLWIQMGNLESRALSDRLRSISLERPVYIAGLARSGTTILLELLASLPGVITHRYRDFPPVFTPYWWNWFLDRAARQTPAPEERAHRDRIEVTAESPEAMEEPLWMAFFPQAHDPTVSNVLDGGQCRAEFERFYRDHIRKLLLIRRGTLYLSKENYNITRLEYLLRLFPEARFLIPIRKPADHIASLLKQHALFSEALKDNPRALAHLRRVGHFEFGLDRRPINTGDRQVIDKILDLWRDHQEVRGWALYWSQIYAYVADRLQANRALRESALVVRYEDLCGSPARTMRSILAHCRLEDEPSVTQAFCERLKLPDYYRWRYSDEELDTIGEVTAATAGRFGY